MTTDGTWPSTTDIRTADTPLNPYAYPHYPPTFGVPVNPPSPVPSVEEINEALSPLQQGPSYDSLRETLDKAFLRASEGKGKERHSNGQDFDKQLICAAGNFFGTAGAAYQIWKKAEESQRLPKEAAINEFLDIIVYAAAAVRILEMKE